MSGTHKRVLFLTYYFPPSGGPGVQRALKFVKYLPAFGWRPTVVTVRPQDASYPDLDPTLCEEIPVGLHVARTRAWDPYALYARLLGKSKGDTVGVGFLGESEVNWKHRLARWVRANLFLPDARVGWAPFAVACGERLLASDPFDAVVTTGPPHSVHLAGRALARRHRLPWLADFRDPWTGIDYYEMLPMTALAKKLDAALETMVLRDASAVTVVSDSMRRRLEGRARNIQVIPNGFDPADFTNDPVEPEPGFTLCYTGNLNEARNPVALWRALAALNAHEKMPDLRIRIVGNVDPAVLASAREYGVGGMVEAAPYAEHARAVRLMQGSTLLLLVINRVPGAGGITTGKLYEYVASGRPVLGIGPVAGDAAAVLRGAKAGCMFDYEDAAGVAELLKRQYHAWRSGAPEQGADEAAAALHSRRNQTRQLAALLDGMAQH